MFSLYDTASRQVTELAGTEVGSVGMYICGPTVYGAPHTGHGRFTLVYDVLRRYLESRGVAVRHVSNVTDIDDKIIARANAEGRSWREVATACEEEWNAAMAAIGVALPHEVPHASDYLAEMIELVGSLVAEEKAYATNDGVYLSVAAVPDYGSLSGQSLEALRAGARVEVVEEKRSPLDFALWKGAKPDEPSWPSPFGPGRPGWHTECVVMSLALLGEGFALHGGGQDLIFPHHENERAQAHADSKHFARHWMHNGLVTVGGEKMSKSLGNFTTLAELLERHDPRAYRLLVLQSHYRQPLEVTDRALADATNALGRVDALARRFADLPDAVVETPEATALARRFAAAMDEDLNTPIAIGALFEALRQANAFADGTRLSDAGALARRVLELFSSVGLRAGSGDELSAHARALAGDRDAARAARDFARADAIRAELESLGWHVEDTPAGTRIYH